jgi:5-methylcytosine-specific restriction endonuclease McrA
MKRRHWSTTVRERVLERFGGICQMCKRSTDERGFDLDHHIPLAIGGEDVEDNLRPLCVPCHRLKTRGDVGDIAKAKRRHAAHIGARAPSRHPMPGGRASPWRKRMDGSVVRRDVWRPNGGTVDTF